MTAFHASPSDAALARLAEVVGDDTARDLARHFGGTYLYVPRTIGEHHPIRAAIGDAADALATWAGGTPIAVPKLPERRDRVLELHRRGALTVKQIARETAYSERQIHRLLRQEDAARQPDLFDEN